MAYKVLLVDDEADNLVVLKEALEKEDFSVLSAARAEEALNLAAETKPDVIVSDVIMPQMGGLALCRELRADRRTAQVPILLVSGLRKAELEQAQGLEAGADDYMLKPYSVRLLAARLRALLRRAKRESQPRGRLKSGPIALDLDARTAAVSSKPVHLTRKEFDLLHALMSRPGRVLGASFLLETVWGYDSSVYRDGHTIEVHLSSLRRKLGPKAAARVATVCGLGYRFDP